MTHKLKTEMFSQKIEYSGGVFFCPLTPLFSFVSFHLKARVFPIYKNMARIILFCIVLTANTCSLHEHQHYHV